MAKLALPPSPKLLAFRKVEQILRNDPVLRRVFGQNWKTWTGQPDDAAALTNPPAIRLTPTSGPQSWYSPDTQQSDLVIGVEVLLSELYADDVLNLWHAIERSLYPHSQTARLTIANALRDACGGDTGLVEFSVPAGVPDTKTVDGGVQLALGQMRLSVWELLNA